MGSREIPFFGIDLSRQSVISGPNSIPGGRADHVLHSVAAFSGAKSVWRDATFVGGVGPLKESEDS